MRGRCRKKRKSYEQQNAWITITIRKLELEKHYLDIDVLVAEGLDEIKGTYEKNGRNFKSSSKSS